MRLYVCILQSCPHHELWHNTPRILSNTLFIIIIAGYSNTHNDNATSNMPTLIGGVCVYVYHACVHDMVM